MSARAEIVDFLRQHLPAEVDVLSFVRDLGDLRRTTVMVETTRITQGPSSGLWEATCSVYVVAPFEDFVKAETELEEVAVNVLQVLGGLQHINLGADRVVLAEKHHAYKVELTFALAKNTEE